MGHLLFALLLLAAAPERPVSPPVPKHAPAHKKRTRRAKPAVPVAPPPTEKQKTAMA
jgi:hypothetical protein